MKFSTLATLSPTAPRNPGAGDPSGATFGVFAFVAILIFVVIGAAVLAAIVRQSRLKKLARLLSARGFVVNVKVQRRPHLPFEEFQKYRGKVVFQITRAGTWDTALMYRYTVGSGDTRRVVRLSCALVPVPFSAAEVSIWRGGSSFFGRRARHRVETDSIRFNERYVATSDDERLAYTLLSYEVVDWLLSEPPLLDGATIRIGAGWMLVARPAIKELDLPELLTVAEELRSTLPAVLVSLYPQAAPPANRSR